MLGTISKAAIAALALGLGVGCASTKDFEALQAEVAGMKNDTAAAQAKADQAQDTANQALQQSQMTDDKVDRMFKASMMK